MDLSSISTALNSLSWEQFAVLALAVSVVDWVGAVLAAVAPPVNYFSFTEAVRVLETHVLKRVFPLAGLAFIAQAIPAGDPRTLVWGLATGALGLYVAETVRSLQSSYGVAKQVAAEAGPNPGTLTSGPLDDGSVDDLNGVPS
jgi:hypothetical protein